MGTRHGRDEVEEGERWSVAVVYQGSSGEGRVRWRWSMVGLTEEK